MEVLLFRARVGHLGEGLVIIGPWALNPMNPSSEQLGPVDQASLCPSAGGTGQRHQQEGSSLGLSAGARLEGHTELGKLSSNGGAGLPCAESTLWVFCRDSSMPELRRLHPLLCAEKEPGQGFAHLHALRGLSCDPRLRSGENVTSSVSSGCLIRQVRLPTFAMQVTPSRTLTLTFLFHFLPTQSLP